MVEEATGESRSDLPAGEDLPRGYDEASWWPFIAAMGVSGIYVGVTLSVMWQAGVGIPPVLGPSVVFMGVLGFLAGLFGWVYHGFVVTFWDETAGDGVGLRFAMVLFLVTEVATFGAGFVYYAFIRTGTWTHLPELVRSGAILSNLVIANTVVLVASSVTAHYAHIALRGDNRRRFLGLLGLTILLGVAFLAGQAYEYYEFIVVHGFTITEGVYASAFYGLTGLHGLHVSLGVVLLGIVLTRALIGQYTADRHLSVTTVSMYWHFVDAVWILLVVVLYAGAVV